MDLDEPTLNTDPVFDVKEEEPEAPAQEPEQEEASEPEETADDKETGDWA